MNEIPPPPRRLAAPVYTNGDDATIPRRTLRSRLPKWSTLFSWVCVFLVVTSFAHTVWRFQKDAEAYAYTKTQLDGIVARDKANARQFHREIVRLRRMNDMQEYGL